VEGEVGGDGTTVVLVEVVARGGLVPRGSVVGVVSAGGEVVGGFVSLGGEVVTGTVATEVEVVAVTGGSAFTGFVSLGGTVVTVVLDGRAVGGRVVVGRGIGG
jgi:hypothetical protein